MHFPLACSRTPLILVFIFLLSQSTSAQNTGEKVQVKSMVFERSLMGDEYHKDYYIAHLGKVVDSLGMGKSHPIYQASLHQLEQILQDTGIMHEWIEVKGDSIWSQRKDGERLVGPPSMVVGKKPVRYFYNNSRTQLKKQRDLTETATTYEILVDKNDRKTIAGYDCYKVHLIETHPGDNGRDHFVMYVTDRIYLPLFAAFNTVGALETGFPLEVNNYNDSDVLGLVYQYRLKSLEVEEGGSR